LQSLNHFADCRSRVSLLPECAEAALGQVGGERVGFYNRGYKVQEATEAQSIYDPRLRLTLFLRQFLLRPSAAVEQ
jgi:hypothetical protein